MLDLGFIACLTAWAVGVGLWVARRFGPVPDHPADAIALAVPVGFGALGLAALGLGEAGSLNRAGLAAVLAVGTVLGGRDAGRGLSKLAKGAILARLGLRSPDLYVLLAGVVGAVGALLTALAPVTDGDALCYHLQVPKVFLRAGAATFDPDLHETVYPLLTEMLYAVALAFRGPVSCRLVQWVLGLVFAANVTALARPSLGARAWWAGAVALLVPAVSNGMGAPLNDVALAAFGTAAMAAWARALDRPSRSAAALAGLVAGLALGVKYPALVLVGLLGSAIGIGPLWKTIPGWWASPTLRRSSGSDRWRLAFLHAAIFGTVAVLVGGCWYARSYVFTGNPVYPFFRHAFGGSGLDEVLDPIKRPMAVTAWNLITALGPMTLQPDRFDSLSHQFGPAFLLFLPALLLERPPRRVLGIAGLGYAFLMICLTRRQSMRFVLIAVGPMAVAVAWLASTWWERRSVPGRILVAIFVTVLAMEAGLAVGRARHGIGVATGRESAESFLARREPTFRVGRWVAENLPSDARIVGQDHRGFYFPCGYTMELAHRRRTGLGRNGESAEEVVAGLRRAGFTHVLMAPPVPESAVEFDPTLGRLLAPWLAERSALYREEIADGDGVVRRYALFDLDDAGRFRR